MKFATRSDMFLGYEPKPVSFPKTAPTYALSVDKDTGREIVVLSGETNVYLQKQEALSETLIYNLIDRIEKTGDYSLLGENLGGFIDVTDMPRNLLEASVVRAQCDQLFASLPSEERAKYGNDVNVFVKSVHDKLRAKVQSQRAGTAAPAPAPAAASEGGSNS